MCLFGSVLHLNESIFSAKRDVQLRRFLCAIEWKNEFAGFCFSLFIVGFIEDKSVCRDVFPGEAWWGRFWWRLLSLCVRSCAQPGTLVDLLFLNSFKCNMIRVDLCKMPFIIISHVFLCARCRPLATCVRQNALRDALIRNWISFCCCALLVLFRMSSTPFVRLLRLSGNFRC